MPTTTTTTTTTTDGDVNGNNISSISITNDNIVLLSSSSLERRMFLFFAMAQFLQIGAYWLIRPVKSGIFARLVGADEEALVRIILTPMLFILLVGYNVLVQSMLLHKDDDDDAVGSNKSSSKLVGLLATPFALLFIIGWFWMAIIGIDNTPSILGWILALASESMCPILVTLNWSIISDAAKDYTSTVASSAFPIITMACQLGCLLGSCITNYLAKKAKGIGSIGEDVGETTLLPVLLCGISLLGVWACMSKANICHNNDIKARRKKVAAAVVKTTNNVIVDGNNNDWVLEYNSNNKNRLGLMEVNNNNKNNNNNKLKVVWMFNNTDVIKGSIRGLLYIISSLYVFSIFIVSTAYEYFDTAFDLQLKQLFTKQANIDCKDTSFYWKWRDEELVDECRHTHFLASYSRNSLNVALLSTVLAITSAILQQYNNNKKNKKVEDSELSDNSKTSNNENNLKSKIKMIISSWSPSSLFGPTWALIIYPIVVGLCFWGVSITTTLTSSDDADELGVSSWLWNISKLGRETIAVQISVMAVKAFGYTLNNPAKEMLYLHTSQEVRYQSKSWIDIWCPKIWSSLAAMVCYQFINNNSNDSTFIVDDDEGGGGGLRYKLLKATLKGIINMGMIALVGIIVLGIWLLASLYAIKEFNNREKELIKEDNNKENDDDDNNDSNK